MTIFLSKTERYEVKIFLPVLYYLASELTKHVEVSSLIRNLFSFFSELKPIGTDELNKNCDHLVNVYHKDFDYGNPF